MIPIITVTDERVGGGITASHNLFGIRINRNARYFAAVLAQEIYEWWFLRWCSLLAFALLAVPCAALLPLPWLPVMLPAILLTCLGLVPTIGPLRRAMELRGQAREIAVANVYYGADLQRLIEGEAKVLAGHYDMFKGVAVGVIEDELLERVEREVVWAKANPGKIHRWRKLQEAK